MTTKALRNDYHGDFKDSQEKYGENILVYIGWDKHLFHCSARAFPLSPKMKFNDIIELVMPEAFSQHPEYEQINWQTAQWTLGGKPFTPDFEASLESQGFDHKCTLRFTTPELKGYAGAGI
jgi:phenol hydroxylase P4 protein